VLGEIEENQMRERTWKARRDKLLAEEAEQPESWWWLSFVDETGFRGAILTRATGFITAIQKTHDLGINPGGEVKGCPIPDEIISASPYNHAQYADQLLSRQDIKQKLGGEAKMP
jgi:hypothetical protein